MLVKTILESSIQQAVEKLYSGQSSKTQFAKDLANAIDSYIRSASIIVPPGQAVVAGTGAGSTTSPSPPAQIS